MREKAFTLLELLVVVSILAMVAAAWVHLAPGIDSKHRIDLAAAEVAAAFRFARSEAMRTGKPHGVQVSQAEQRVRVYQLQRTPLPATRIYSVRHPVDKKLYDLRFNSDRPFLGVAIQSAAFYFGGDASPGEFISFDAGGIPGARALGPARQLDSAQVRLQAGDDERTIRIAPGTGRVSVQ